MNIGTFMGGMGQAYEGAEQGIQQQRDIQNAADDRAYLATQRQFQQGQQERTAAAQDREEAVRAKVAALPTVGSEIAPVQAADGGSDASTNPSSADAQNGSDVGFDVNAPAPIAAKLTQDSHLRQVADAYSQAGDSDRASTLYAQADQLGMQRASREYMQLAAGAGSRPLVDVANEAAKIFSNDPTPGKVSNITSNPDGSVTMTMTNRDTGWSVPKTFKNTADLLQTMQAHYSPENFAAIQQMNAKIAAERQAKIDEEAAKTQIVGPGSTMVRPNGDTLHVDKTFRPQATPPIKPRDQPLGQGQAILADAFEKGDVKASSPKQRADAEDYLDRVIGQNPNIPPARAARIAIDAATNPTSTQPAIAPNGTIDLTYVDTDGARYRLVPNIADATTAKAKGITPEMMSGAVTTMLSQAGDDAAQQRLIKAASDQTARAALITDLQAQATKVADQAVAQASASKSSVPEATIRQTAMFRAQQDGAALARKLDLIKAFPPAAAPTPGAAGSALAGILKPGGLPVGDPAAAVPAGFGQLDQRVAASSAAKQAADAAAAAKTKAASDAVAAGQKEAAWLTPERIHAMSPAEIQEVVKQYGTKLTKPQATEIYNSRYHDLLPGMDTVLERHF